MNAHACYIQTVKEASIIRGKMMAGHPLSANEAGFAERLGKRFMGLKLKEHGVVGSAEATLDQSTKYPHMALDVNHETSSMFGLRRQEGRSNFVVGGGRGRTMDAAPAGVQTAADETMRAFGARQLSHGPVTRQVPLGSAAERDAARFSAQKPAAPGVRPVESTRY